MSLALLFHYLLLNMFRMLTHPSSGACDLFVELFHGLYWSGSMCVGVTLWFGCGGVVSVCRLRMDVLTFERLLVTWCTTSLTFNNCTLCPHCIYVFCVYLGTNSDLCHLQHKLTGFCNQDEKCSQRGTDWVFKYSSMTFVFKGLASFIIEHWIMK